MIAILFMYIVTVAVYCYLLYWIWKLEKTGCVCSKNWRRDFIMYWMIIYSFIALLILLVKNLYVIILFASCNIAFIVIVFQYVHKLKTIKCECSDGTERKVMEIFNYIQLGLIVVSIIGSLIVAVYSFSSAPPVTTPPQMQNVVTKPQATNSQILKNVQPLNNTKINQQP